MNKINKNNNKKSMNLIEELRQSFDEENQIVETKMKVGNFDFSIFHIESLIDKKLFSSSILAPLEKLDASDIQDKTEIFEIVKSVISVSSKQECSDLTQIKDNLFLGQVIVVFKEKAICCPIFFTEKRGIQEPPNSKVVKGPREGFVEEINTNTGLVRKRLKTPELRILDIFVGEKSKTKVSIFYINGVAKKEIVEEIKTKIQAINIDAVIDSYYVESFLEGEKLKFFRRMGNTEKPDVFCAKILEGRVGILVDGSPVALTAPFVLLEDLQSVEDYYTFPAIATFTRILRIFGLIIAILAPGVYVALQSYNYRILPINFLITILSSIEGLSIPPLLEMLFVVFLFEIILEASLRMPDPLSMALSIIGALALGNTAVDAGIISPPSIVIVAVSSVALYVIPDQIAETRILRLLLTSIGGIIGLYGIFVGMIILSTYLCSIESFGVPYLAPYAPSVKSDKKDGFIKKSIQAMQKRPFIIAGKDKIRQGNEKNQEANKNDG